MPELLREFGPAGATLVALMALFAWLLKTVIAGFQQQIEHFTAIVSNHIAHSTQVMAELQAAIRELRDEIRRLRPEGR
jgi:type II secretory pathway component PulJ